MNKFLKQILWFDDFSKLIEKECQKYVQIKETKEVRVLRDKVIKKIETAKNLLHSISNSGEPYIRELVYILYWSCLNELVTEKIGVDTKNGEIKFQLNGDILPLFRNANVYYKNVKRIYIGKEDYFELEIYKKYKFSVDPSKYIEYKKEFERLSFNVQFYLLENGFNEHVLIQFSLLNKSRNQLNIIHGKRFDISIDSNNFDNVELEDCRLMLYFLYLLIRMNVNDIRDKVNEHFYKTIKIPPIMDSSELIIKGILKRKIQNGKYTSFLITYLLDSNSDELLFQCNVNETDFNKYNENDILNITYEIKAKPSNSNNNFFNNYINAKKIIKNT